MKKTYLALIFLVLVNTNVFCQVAENKNIDKKFTFQTSPLLFVYDLISLGIGEEESTLFIMDFESQYKINDLFNVSFTLSFLINNHISYGTTYYYYPNYYTETYSYKENTFQINLKPMFVYRPFRTGLKGFYIGFYPNIGWQSVKNERDNDYLWTEVGVGINTGYKWVFNNGFTIQLGTGIGKTWSIPEKPEDFLAYQNSDGRITLKNLDLLILDFKLGYSF
jgi:hypothetical protein